MPSAVIYTDMDGSLLDHFDYSHAAADALLQELEQSGIPVVPCTSKTRAELLPIRGELNNQHPFIVENGAAIFVPKGYFPQQPSDTDDHEGFWVKAFTRPHRHWVGLLEKLAHDFSNRFNSFSRLSTDEIMALTGLEKTQAEQAAQREYGEPVQWIGNAPEKHRFIQALETQGARVLLGGRFLHVSGNCDKGSALRWLHRQFADRLDGPPPLSLAIGDSQNDIAMLEAADHALVIRSPAHPPPQLHRDNNTYLSKSTGPTGWNEGVRLFLQHLN